jgi:hypothetical protein
VWLPRTVGTAMVTTSRSFTTIRTPRGCSMIRSRTRGRPTV